LHALLLQPILFIEIERQINDMQGAITVADRLNLKYVYNDIGEALVELETVDATGDYGVTHGFLVALVHKIPNVDPPVVSPDYDDSWTERTEPSTGDHAVLVIGGLEDGH
jgi:hypothetical protein